MLEQDFIDNTLMKYVEVLHDAELLNQDFYLKLKYGVSDEEQIVLIRNGISITLADLLMTKYQVFINIDVVNNTVDIDKSIIEKMQENDENEILIYEAQCNLYYE